jgi:sugar/nucleoside kinase (ribokinase family)
MKKMTPQDILKATIMAQDIEKNLKDIGTFVANNVSMTSPTSLLSMFSALNTITSYYEVLLQKNGADLSTIQETKKGSEQYVLTLVAEDDNVFTMRPGSA